MGALGSLHSHLLFKETPLTSLYIWMQCIAHRSGAFRDAVCVVGPEKYQDSTLKAELGGVQTVSNEEFY